MDRIKKSSKNHKYLQDKKTMKLKLLKGSFAWIMTCL